MDSGQVYFEVSAGEGGGGAIRYESVELEKLREAWNYTCIGGT